VLRAPLRSMLAARASSARGSVFGGRRAPRRAGGHSRALAAMGLNDLLKMMMADKLSLVDPAQALPGRDAVMQVSPKHFVNGNAMQAPWPQGMEVVTMGTGCFWGSEKSFWRMPGVYSTAVGYAGGYTNNPTYEEVCSGQTGHTEAVQIVYDPTVVSMADLLRTFWTSHDPTAGMGQGNDMGTQYRSAIYPTTKEQLKQVEASKAAYEKALADAGRNKITTEISLPEDKPVHFYYAEDYHQQYLAKPGSRPYCSAAPTGVDCPMDWATGADAPKLPDKYWEKHAPRPGCTIGFPNEPIKLEEL